MEASGGGDGANPDPDPALPPWQADEWRPLHLASKLGYAPLVKLMLAEEAYTVVNLTTVVGE